MCESNENGRSIKIFILILKITSKIAQRESYTIINVHPISRKVVLDLKKINPTIKSRPDRQKVLTLKSFTNQKVKTSKYDFLSPTPYLHSRSKIWPLPSNHKNEPKPPLFLRCHRNLSSQSRIWLLPKLFKKSP